MCCVVLQTDSYNSYFLVWISTRDHPETAEKYVWHNRCIYDTKCKMHKMCQFISIVSSIWDDSDARKKICAFHPQCVRASVIVILLFRKLFNCDLYLRCWIDSLLLCIACYIFIKSANHSLLQILWLLLTDNCRSKLVLLQNHVNSKNLDVFKFIL